MFAPIGAENRSRGPFLAANVQHPGSIANAELFDGLSSEIFPKAKHRIIISIRRGVKGVGYASFCGFWSRHRFADLRL